MALVFRVIDRVLLPSPYETGCEEEGKRGACFASCFRQRTGRRPHTEPLGVSSHSLDKSPPDAGINATADLRVTNECRDACPPECARRSFASRVTQSLFRWKGGVVAHVHPMTDRMEITSVPCVFLSDLILLSLYSAAFWLSFSPASCLASQWLHRCFCR